MRTKSAETSRGSVPPPRLARPVRLARSRAALAWRSLRHHGRAQLPTALGVALTAAVLTGALLVGDSVRTLLARHASERLGRVEWAVELPPGRGVADTWVSRVGGGNVLALPAMVLADAPGGGEPIQVNRARVLGVDAAAWRLIAGDTASVPAADEVVLNSHIARRLGVGVGDRISLRVSRWSPLPRDAPLAARKDLPTVRWSARVGRVLADAEGGRFGLEATQTAPLAAFVPLQALQARSGWDSRANLLLFGSRPDPAQTEAWTLSDLGHLWTVTNGVALLHGPQVFLDPTVADAAPEGTAKGLAYLVDGLENSDGTRRTPYSFVVGVTPQDDPRLGPVRKADAADAIIANAWLAEQLGVGVGDTVVVRYRRWEADGGVVSESRTVRVARIVSMEEARLERGRLPAFPGLTDVDRCADWDVGMDLDPEALKDPANEAYWNAFGPAPKAFLPLVAVQQMVGSRFGTAMDLRVPAVAAETARVDAAVRQRLDAAAVGLAARPVRVAAFEAARGAVDFGGLFLGLSFFLLAAGLLLAALLCTLAVLRRSGEIAALRAVGFGERAVFGLVFREFLGVSAVACGAGALLGAGYARALLWSLARGWSGALADAAPRFVWSVAPVVQGAVAAWVASGVALALAVRATLRSNVLALWRSATPCACGSQGPASPTRKPRFFLARIFGFGMAARPLSAAARGKAHASASSQRPLPQPAARHAHLANAGLMVVGIAAAPFGPMGAMVGGALVLAACVGMYAFWVRAFGLRNPTEPVRTLAAIGQRGSALRPGRDRTVMAVLACGVFMVCAVTAMHQDVARDAKRRTAATGGFELMADLAVPAAPADLAALGDLPFVGLRVLEGEDAGCLNLNAVAAPRVIGIPVDRFAELGVFGITEGWRALDAELPGGVVPAWAGDRDTAQWGLKATLDAQRGTEFAYRSGDDTEWRIRLVDACPLRMTLFQGSVLVSAARLARAFPSVGGASLLLVDASSGGGTSAEMRLRAALGRHGIDVERVVDRLRAFYRVESTYLDMFLVLGGLGLLVATVGVGLVLARNAEERKSELAVLAVLGYSRQRRTRLLWQGMLPAQVAGLGAGVLSASLALWPALWRDGANVPWVVVLGGLSLVVASSLGSSWLLARLASRADFGSLGA